MRFKYLVLGNHPTFRYINRRCLTIEEANNVKDGLEAVGYEVEIKKIQDRPFNDVEQDKYDKN